MKIWLIKKEFFQFIYTNIYYYYPIMRKKIINFIRYHNGFTIALILVFISSATIFASEDARTAIIGEEIITETGIDNTMLLETDLDNFDPEIEIKYVSEDDNNYYIDYIFNTMGIMDNIWQIISRQKTLTVSKNDLGNRDLGLYVTEEFFKIAKYEINNLKKSREIEKEKGETTIKKAREYTKLIGLVLNIKDKILPEYEPVIVQKIIEPSISDSATNTADIDDSDKKGDLAQLEQRAPAPPSINFSPVAATTPPQSSGISNIPALNTDTPSSQ